MRLLRERNIWETCAYWRGCLRPGLALLMPSPTQRSLAFLRAEGYTVAIVEHWNAFAKIRQDLFGFVDLLALRPGETLAVQTTSGDNVSKRIAKIAEHELLPRVLEAGWIVEVHGWRKIKGKWEVRRERM